MDERTGSQSSSDKLTPEQSADVIRYYNDNENKIPRENGWKDKVPLAESAIHAMLPRHSMLPNKKPLLTGSEVSEGFEHIENPPKADEQPKSEEYYRKLERLVDQGHMSYDDARRQLEAEGFEEEHKLSA